MNVAFGMKAHSGWAVLVVVGRRDRHGNFVVVDRRRLELVEDEWARQPYHAAEELKPEAAREMVERGVEAAHRLAVREVGAAVKREKERGNAVKACAVLTGDPMPAWSVDEILAVHFRMHKAEGVLFRRALIRAAKACRLRPLEIPEKLLARHAEAGLAFAEGGLDPTLAALGRSVGSPWGKDQKDAALAAMVALEGRPR